MTFGFHEKRYNALAPWLRQRFGERVQKVCIDAGLTCPNRDGTKGRGGCVFCSSRGSGAGHILTGLEVADQVRAQIDRMSAAKGVRKFIAYFQAFTNTWAPLNRLRELYDAALRDDRVVGLSIATRGDCVTPGIIELLGEYRDRGQVWLELGLETANQSTLDRMNRCERVDDFMESAALAVGAGIEVVAHVIFGLPGDTATDALRSVELVNRVGASGIKIHNLYVDRHSRLAAEWRRGSVAILPLSGYVGMVCDALERLRPQVLVHRLTGEAPARDLLAPEWVRDKGTVLRAIEGELERRGSWQGAKYVEA